MKLAVGDKVRLSRQHPCGGEWWSITRTGIDIGLECLTCGRRVMVSRRRLERRIKEHVQVSGGDNNAS